MDHSIDDKLTFGNINSSSQISNLTLAKNRPDLNCSLYSNSNFSQDTLQMRQKLSESVDIQEDLTFDQDRLKTVDVPKIMFRDKIQVQQGDQEQQTEQNMRRKGYFNYPDTLESNQEETNRNLKESDLRCEESLITPRHQSKDSQISLIVPQTPLQSSLTNPSHLNSQNQLNVYEQSQFDSSHNLKLNKQSRNIYFSSQYTPRQIYFKQKAEAPEFYSQNTSQPYGYQCSSSNRSDPHHHVSNFMETKKKGKNDSSSSASRNTGEISSVKFSKIMGEDSQKKFGTVHNMVYDKENISSAFQSPSDNGYFMRNNFMKKDIGRTSSLKKYSSENKFHLEIVESEIRSSSFFRGLGEFGSLEMDQMTESMGLLNIIYEFKGIENALKLGLAKKEFIYVKTPNQQTIGFKSNPKLPDNKIFGSLSIRDTPSGPEKHVNIVSKMREGVDVIRHNKVLKSSQQNEFIVRRAQRNERAKVIHKYEFKMVNYLTNVRKKMKHSSDGKGHQNKINQPCSNPF